MSDQVEQSEHTDQLLASARAGDARAFDRLFELHRGLLKRMVEVRMNARLRSRFDASDVVQEAHAEAFARLGDFVTRRPMPFALWLRKTTQERLSNLERAHLRSARRTVVREVGLPDHSSDQLARRLAHTGSTPSQAVIRQEMVDRVRAGLDQLADADREILVMRYLEDLSNSEVAAILEIEPAAASKRHGRALLKLQSLLRQGGLESEP